MNDETRQAVTPQLVIGVFITLLGILLTFDRLGLIEAGLFRPFWPSVLVAIGVSLLIQRRDSSGRFWGVVWTVLGSWLLLNSLGILRLRFWELLGPVLLIVIGWNIVRRTIYPDPPAPPPPLGFAPSAPDWPGSPASAPSEVPPVPEPGSGKRWDATAIPRSHDGGRVSLVAVLGEAKRTSNDRPFRGGEMTAIMGGCVLDLRLATLAPGEEARLNLLAFMAGHEIRVPPGWLVLSDVVPIMGGVDDKRLSLESTPNDAPRLRLKGFIVMGGVVIRS